ncbi:MAG: ImcF-related family protein [Pseudomonas sp.]|uniref:ImcF-related family protein n=1 Tax=Pseudomonas sp. TaxID=306 RepID=UPI003D6F2EFF
MTVSSRRWRFFSAMVLFTAIACGIAWGIYRYGPGAGLAERSHQVLTFLLVLMILFIALVLPRVLTQVQQRRDTAQAQIDGVLPQPDACYVSGAHSGDRIRAMCAELKARHGPFWRRKFRLLLVFGEPEQIKALAPDLTAENHWLEGQGVVLIWGGSVQGPVAIERIQRWRRLCRYRSFDGVVWALSEAQSLDASIMTQSVRHLRALGRQLHWQLPLHVWQVGEGKWSQAGRTTQPVGCVLPSAATALALTESLQGLLAPMRERGWSQMQEQLHHDFLLRLSRDLQVEGIARWGRALAPLFGLRVPGVTLRGLWFSDPVTQSAKKAGEASSFWMTDPAWGGVLEDRPGPVRRVGWPLTRVVYAGLLSLSALWGLGLAVSFVSNRTQVMEIEHHLAAVQPSGNRDEQLRALYELMRELRRLDQRASQGESWHLRLGLSQNGALRDALWPLYVEANHRLMRDPAAANLERQLRALTALPPGSQERNARAQTAYEQLKAYLMMARPDKVDAPFLAKTLEHAEPQRDGIGGGEWQTLSPALWRFYAEQLSAHPQWRIELDARLLAEARQVLIGQLGRRNGEASLYRQVLDTAAPHYSALGLHDLVGETDAATLFATQASVPGVFTRQAWEGHVRGAIDDIAEARREKIDWVLSDREGDIAADLTPDKLRERLTERYFQEYGSAWLSFLNSLRWQRTRSLGEVVDQLTLMSDVRQSPFIALMNSLAWQGQAGSRMQALGESLLKSAEKLVGREKTAVIDQSLPDTRSPLDTTFGPLLSLMGKQAGTGDDQPSLQAYLTRVTRSRLKLQQIGNAADPQAMTQAMAQTVFQGKGIDLTDTQAYASLLAASLGAEWNAVGQTLFVQPLEQAWQQVLQPSAASINRQWQQAIVDHWNEAFSGRYPFAATGSDASLSLLGQLIRADSGRIEQFLQRQLNGVLRKEGNRWVVDPQSSQGLQVNPDFLAAINQLSHLADVLYTDGGMGLSFELQGKPVRDVVQTTFTLNGERHAYFNQKESWQRFGWPGISAHPGASLTWTSVRTGERLYADFQGTWGLIRLLEEAQVTPLDDNDSRFRVVIQAPDGLDLTWYLRTELGAGPMSLLTLRNFKLPAQVFVTQTGKKRLAMNEDNS